MPFFIDVFHGFYRTAIVPTFIDIVPFLINIVPTYNLFLNRRGDLYEGASLSQCQGILNVPAYFALHSPEWRIFMVQVPE